MSKYILDEEIERLFVPDSDDKEWVDIKKHLTASDQDYMKEKLVEIEVNTGLSREERRRIKQSGKTDELVKAKYKLNTVPLLILAIKDWSFTNSDGATKIPVTPENIAKMAPWLANWLEDEIDSRNPLQPSTPSNTTTS